MPILKKGSINIDYSDDGHGPVVILIHSSVSGNRQWRSLIDDLKESFRVLAPNLYGYGETTSWPREVSQSLFAQAQLISMLCENIDQPIHLVGHSFGGSVALKTASILGSSVQSMVLLEPNPFFLLKQQSHSQAFMEVQALRDYVKSYGALEEWEMVAQRFVAYWMGDGVWDNMPEKRRDAFIKSLPPNFSEWDAVKEEQSTISDMQAIPAKTLVVSDGCSQRPIIEIVRLFENKCPHWSFKSLQQVGHMAALTHPQIINPIVRRFLEEA